MKQVFALVAVFFVGLYFYAQTTLEHPKNDGITRIRWATDDNPARKVQTSAFHTMFPKSEVSVDPGMGGDQTKLIVQCATGTGPDVIDIYDVAGMSALVEAGVLVDLTPYAKELGIDPAHTYPSLRNGLIYGGKQYRYPCNVWANCVIFNKRVFDDCGVPYPKPDWTYQDFVNVCKQLLRKKDADGKSKYIAFANMSGQGFWQDYMIGNGGRYFSPDGLSCNLASPESRQAMRFYCNMMYQDKVIPTAAEAAAMTSQGGWGNSAMSWFTSGKAAMISIGRWFIIQVPQYPNLKGVLGAVTLPHVGNRPSSGATDTRAAGINIKSPHRKEALQFLKYLASREYNEVIVQDGDSLPPNPIYARDGKALVNDIVPDPAFHQPFVDAMKSSHPTDFSPYCDEGQVNRWVGERVSQVENQVETPDEALKSLAQEINQTIRVNLERRPDLQRRYQELTGRKWTPDWWRTYQKQP